MLGGILLICQNATMRAGGAWIKIYMFKVQKHAPQATCHNLPIFRDKPLGAPTFVRLVIIPMFLNKTS